MVQNRVIHLYKRSHGLQNQEARFKQATSVKLFSLRLPKIISFLVTISLWLASNASNAQPSPVITPLINQNSAATPDVSSPRLLASGNQVSLNGRTLPAAWSQWQNQDIRTAISDAGMTQLLGVELLNTEDATKQPVQWFSQPITTPLILASWLTSGARYLDVTDFARKAGWQLQPSGNTLHITSPAARVQTIRQGRQPWGDRIVLDLNRPTSWQIQQQSVSKTSNQEWTITIDAAADSALIQAFNPSSSNQLLNSDNSQTRILKVETTPTLTTIRLSVPSQLSPRVSTLPNPNRLIIDLRPDAMVERDILWAKGLRWRQKFVNLGSDRFPVVWLEINPRTTGLTLKPITSEATTIVGIAPLTKTARAHSAAAAINGGFFNRKNQLPLGAIRRDGRWLSSPILNRGAIAWNDSGLVKINRLSLQETIITSTGRLPISTFNSGYVQAGIARYSSAWGSTYTPLTDNEIIVVVQNNQVTAQLPASIAGKTTFPIPSNGYLLAIRDNNAAVGSLAIGTLVREESATVPADFGRYPYIIGAGPVLVQNRQIVLNAKSEGFSDAFIREKAARSAIGVTDSGTVLIAAVHNRPGGAGPTLSEIAKVMQQMGCVDALNFDGGSSTSLYLGGQLLNRSPRTAARVHNGLGVFLPHL